MNVPAAATLFGISAPRREWLLLFLCIALALVVAFLPGAEGGQWGVQNLGYLQMLILLGLTGWFSCRYAKARWPVYRRWWCRAGMGGTALPFLLVAAASIFAHVHFPHRLKVLTDEASLAATSLAIQQHRLVYTPSSAEARDGVFVPSVGYINKRPFLHSVLVSLLHDLTGYRWNNGIWLNAVLTLPTMALFFMLGRRLWRRCGGAIALLLAGGVPIIAQTMTGGGLEVLNLVLLLAVTYCGLRLWSRPTEPLLGLVATLACLLGYVRYESGLYLVPVGALVVAVLRRWRPGRIPAVLYAVPLLCAPMIWLQLIAFAHEKEYFQLSARNDGSAFSLAYMAGNLNSAYEYFLVPNPVHLSAPPVFVLGGGGVVCLLMILLPLRGRGHSARDRTAWTLAGLTMATLVNAALFLAFNYGQYGEYITQRISLPVWGVAVLLATWACGRWRWRRAGSVVGLVGVFNLFWFCLPAAGGNFSESEYAYGKDFAFVAEYAERMPPPHGVKVISHVPVFWLVQRCPAIGPGRAEAEKDSLIRSLQVAEIDRLLVHYFEYSPYYRPPDPVPARPPGWFASVPKRLVERRWIARGTWSVIYEVLPQAVSGPKP